MIVLDTHVLLWYISNPKNLSKKAFKFLESEREKGELIVSSISVWEIYMLVQAGRSELTMEVDKWLNSVEHLGFIQFEPINNAIAAKSVMLPGEFHKDPADRIIVATALTLDASLITKDARIQKYKYVKTVW